MRTGLGLALTLPRRRPGGGGPAVPALLRLSVITGGQDFQSSINNDGSLWFWPGGGPGTMQTVLTNIEPDNVEGVSLLVESREATSGAVLGWSVQSGGTWAIDNTTYDPADGGSLASPTVLYTGELTLPTPVAQAGTFRMHVVQGDGLLSAGKTFTDGSWPSSVQAASANFNPGSYLNSVPSAFVGIGPFQGAAILRLASSAVPRAIVWVFGDSTGAEVRPLAATDNQGKEGVWFRANEYARTNSIPIRIYSRAQGGATWSDIQARVRANIASLAGKCNAIGVMVATWNTPIEGVAAANAAWAEYLVLEAEVLAAGFPCFPYILHPYTTRNTANQISGWNQLRDLVVAHGGLDFSVISGAASYPDLPGAESEDNIHQNGTGSVRTGPLILPLVRTWLQTYYTV